MNTDVNVGQIWEVTTELFLTSGQDKPLNRQVKLKKGEKLEIRYPYEWHFRTEDNQYFHCEEVMILQNCKLIGKIWEKIKWQNEAKLDEILRLRLYDPINNNQIK